MTREQIADAQRRANEWLKLTGSRVASTGARSFSFVVKGARGNGYISEELNFKQFLCGSLYFSLRACNIYRVQVS